MSHSSTISFPVRLTPAETRLVRQGTVYEPSFTRFLWEKKVNRMYLGIGLAGMIAQFIVFKRLYPFGDFFSDSYSYLYAAYANLDVSIWPIGYSKFLWAFHHLTYSDTALVGFQYLFLELSALYLFFTVLYFYAPGRSTAAALFIFLIFNPISAYLSNYINSDPLFAAVSICWFTQLIWILHRPRLYQVFTQGVLLFIAFTIRNNAYIYPFIAVIAFILSRQRLWIKITGSFLGPLLILPFILHTREAAKQLTGTAQFSLFTGWQLANNALYMYGDITVDSAELPTPATREVNALAKQLYSRVVPQFHEGLAEYTGNFFIRQPESPLKQYIHRHYRIPDYSSEVLAWGKVSPVYADFGSYLIKKHPWEFIRYYMLLNAKNYFLPPLEKLQVYNLGSDEVDDIAQSWFHYKTTRVRSVSRQAQGTILYLFPSLFLLANLIFIGYLGWFLVTGGIKKASPYFNRSLLLTASFLALNFGFCVFATIIVFRYEVFPMICCVVFDLLLVDWMDKAARQKPPDKQIAKP
jgi:hypothetical protein